MKKLTTFLLSAITLVTVCASFTPRDHTKTRGIEPVYLFGFSFSFSDSTVYFTDIQRIDSAETGVHGMLMKRPVFSEQMRNYLMQNGVNTPTCAIFFSTSPHKVEKQMSKIMKQYEKQNLLWRILPGEEFSFINIPDSQP